MPPQTLRQKLHTFLLRTRRRTPGQAEALLRFAEEDLPPFVRRHLDATFDGIYALTDHQVYAEWRGQVADQPAAVAENDAADGRFTEALKLLADFYDSATFRGPARATLSAFEAAQRPRKTDDPLEPATDPADELREGCLRQVNLTRHERNPLLRQRCIRHYGPVCQVCGINFEARYGTIGRGFIEVHHLAPLAATDGEHALDPVSGLVPLCSNCHSMIHRGGTDALHPLTLEALRTLYRSLTPSPND